MIQLSIQQAKPLDIVVVKTDSGNEIRVYDAQGRMYVKEIGKEISFMVSGALGYHIVSVHDTQGVEIDRIPLRVDCQTELDDDSGRFKKFMFMLKHTFLREQAREKIVVAADGETYWLQAITSRDSVHAMKGAMYFCHHMKDVVDLFAKYQRNDGMIWDFGSPMESDDPYHFEWRWPPDFKMRVSNGRLLFARQPVENDLEHMFIRGIYQVWKLSGDDAWMKSKLDHGLRAMRFSRTSPWFWSEKYQLLKRPYTIDTWDFQSQFDAERVGGDMMDADLEKTVYGIMHGDNTGMADACRKLAEMLRFTKREYDAVEALEYANHLQSQLDKVAWNGEFYTHHVSEDPSFERDFGVDESRQVSLSNAYALNRGIDHEKAVAIIKTYQRIRKEMPKTALAEFYQIYPPFERGWKLPKWQYMNGAVTTLVAGELARGAFMHGFEEYGADILDRIRELSEPYGERFRNGFRGAMPEEPERTFEPIDIRSLTNANLVCEKGADSPGWVDEPGFDCRELPTGKQVFHGVPFDIIEPATNNSRACLRLAANCSGYAEKAVIPVNKTFESLYFLHIKTGPPNPIAGEIRFIYEDGSEVSKYIVPEKHISDFWVPKQPDKQHNNPCWDTVVAWRGKCPRFYAVGLIAHGMENPYPDKKVKQLQLLASREGAIWLVVGLTTSDAPPFFMPDTFAHGIPPNWGAGALASAFVEGLIGVNDTGRNMDAICLSPRWEAANVKKVTGCIKYEAGGGYVRYMYKCTNGTIRINLAGNSTTRKFEILLPPEVQVEEVLVNDSKTDFTIKEVERSRYVCFESEGIAVTTISIALTEIEQFALAGAAQGSNKL